MEKRDDELQLVCFCDDRDIAAHINPDVLKTCLHVGDSWAKWTVPYRPEDFPEMEILWQLTCAWNTGILLYSLAEYPEGWCGLGMSFLRHLGSLQESYQTQMSDLYTGPG
ncbi:testis-expressed protein 11 [Salmo salar]|uniref:Testis-expressed sequence 11 protein-like n=1 Tax=Salmo salar TaxID=8030 RepID=A0A1S3STT8_SALSA|nr:testis-expressed protein 11-like [Salmo salar]XP_014067760.1 testis-expressed protein 11-like [Salmo salar]|eukprot:XP_014067759.1 PREDICTED: testis-expressed sequence 11 protein-like [Salmo salar]